VRPYWLRTWSVERVCQGCLDAGERVVVSIERGCDRGVAEPGLDQLRMRAGGDEQGGITMTSAIHSGRRWPAPVC
jgi:hypothetical protein